MLQDFLYLLLAIGFWFGVIPILFIVINGFIMSRRYKMLLPVIIVMALYQTVMNYILHSQHIPGTGTFWSLTVVMPLVMGIASGAWTLVYCKERKERAYGLVISVLGYLIAAFQSGSYIFVMWSGV